ncbi:hypothetical protein OG923_33930 (plasmid) [Streptomyces halstedii]|uniref:hypothetical protein n=1 Tax=Streptomyces halstedii TaxID=1944 RepID=UPI002F918191
MNRPSDPYVIPWTGENTSAAPVRVTPAGVAYADPVVDALQRDLDYVLWDVCGGTATGRPAYTAELHPERQRTAMEGFLCAACKKPAARDRRGMAWVLPLPQNGPECTRWENVRTEIPPMCTGCVKTVPRRCPRLRAGHVELRVRQAERIGVRGTLHPRPATPGLRAERGVLVLDDSPDLPFVVARQVIRELREVTVVSFAATV